jgi:hypothetical protein
MIFDMLTADAASKHGHEFSDPQPARWLVPRRSPFRVFPYTARNRLPSRPRVDRGAMSDLKEEPEELEASGEQLKPQISISHLRIPGSFHDHPPSPPLNNPLDIPETPAPNPPTARAIDLSPIQPVPDDIPKISLEKRGHRPKTQYAFAHPPPTGGQLRKQGIIRPNTLFQLHTQTASGFHKPVYEVLPLNLLGNNNVITNRLKRFGRGKLTLGTKDLAIIKASPYNLSEGSTEGSSNPASRDVLGIISASTGSGDESRRSAQIVLDSAVWVISQKRKDIYDLSLLGDASRGARWYIPRSQRSSVSPVDGQSESKFYFAALLPNTKKHPTVASMTRTSLDVYDTYTAHGYYQHEDTHQSNHSRQLSDCSSSISSQSMSAKAPPTPLSIETDETLRRLIIVSGVWVALCEGWSPHMIADMEQLNTVANVTPTPRRSASLPQESISIHPLASDLEQPKMTHCIKRSLTKQDPKPIKSVSLKLPNSVLAKVSVEPNIKEEPEPEELPPPEIVTIPPISPPEMVLSSPIPTADDQTFQGNIESSPSPDPTAQFRHLMSMDLTSHSPSPPPASKREGLLRRRSTHTSNPASRDSSHSRSVSWTRRLSLHGVRSRDSKPTSQTTSAASSEYDAQNHGYDGSIEGNSGINTTEQSLRSLTPPVASPTADAASFRADSVLCDQSIEANARNQAETPLEAIPSAEESRPGTAIRKQPDADGIVLGTMEESRPSSSEESSGSSIIGVGSPYWRDFDKIQSRAFVTRAEQIQYDPNATSAVEACSTEATPSVQKSDGDVHEDMNNTKPRWFSGLRQSVSRRRRSMV